MQLSRFSFRTIYLATLSSFLSIYIYTHTAMSDYLSVYMYTLTLTVVGLRCDIYGVASASRIDKI